MCQYIPIVNIFFFWRKYAIQYARPKCDKVMLRPSLHGSTPILFSIATNLCEKILQTRRWISWMYNSAAEVQKCHRYSKICLDRRAALCQSTVSMWNIINLGESRARFNSILREMLHNYWATDCFIRVLYNLKQKLLGGSSPPCPLPSQAAMPMKKNYYITKSTIECVCLRGMEIAWLNM